MLVPEGEIGSLFTFFLEEPLVIELLLVREIFFLKGVSCVRTRGSTVRFLVLND